MTTSKDLQDVEVFEAMLNSYTDPHTNIKDHIEKNLTDQTSMISISAWGSVCFQESLPSEAYESQRRHEGAEGRIIFRPQHRDLEKLLEIEAWQVPKDDPSY